MKTINIYKTQNIKFPFILICALYAFSGYAQKVTNVTATQEQNTIIVSYNLETTQPCSINLLVSTDNAVTWKGPLTQVKGDAGNEIEGGNHSITWQVLDEYNELRGDNIKFKVEPKAAVDKEAMKIIGTPIKIGKLEIAQYDFPRDMNWADANAKCKELGVGWRLPAQEELQLMYNKKDKIGGFALANYWSAAEYNVKEAWYQSFNTGYMRNYSKSDIYSVRAVRTK